MNENSPNNDGYVRPNEKWVCGRGSQQCDCPLGPIARGRFAGAKCSSENEKKCRPKRSLREKRKFFTIGITAMVLGLVLIGCWQPWRADFVAPGPLSASHAQLFHQDSATENRCAACHEAANRNSTEWLLDALTGGNHIDVPQSSKCMECHEDTLVADLALAAHNVGPEALSRITESQVDMNRVNTRLFKPAHDLHSEIACSACHREHHGKDHDLASLTDTQCQSCHQNQFEDFAFDHPDFGDWTTRVSLGIEFDHGSHLQKHFPEKMTAFDCKQCHKEDARGNVQLLTGFENSCAKCHEKSIDGNLSKGIELVTLPMIDTTRFAEAGLNIGTWPENASGGFDGEIPAMMRALLVADPKGREALESLGDDFEFYDLEEADQQQLVAAAELLWSIKRLVGDLATKGEAGIRERLEISLPRRAGQPVSQTEHDLFGQLASHIPSVALADMQKSWFPKLLSEIANRNRQDGSDSQVRSVGGKKIPLKFASHRRRTGNERDDEVGNQELLLENPLKEKFAAGLPQIKDARAELPPETLNGNGINQRIPTSTKPDEVAVAPPVHQLETPPPASNNDDSSLLQENPLKGYGRDATIPKRESPRVKVDSRDSVPKLSTPEPSIEPSADPTIPLTPQETEAALRQYVRDQLYPAGDKAAGWLRSDERMSFTYRPSGHGDQFVRTWLDVLISSNVKHSKLASETNPLAGTGYCLSCHGSSQGGTDISVATWDAKYRDTTRRDFTKFDHGPHLLQTSIQDCDSCHVMQLDTVQQSELRTVSFGSQANTKSLDPHHSDFIAIGKNNCVKCHNQTAVSQSCTECHGYHVGSKVLK